MLIQSGNRPPTYTNLDEMLTVGELKVIISLET
jgi:hypothetical protein